MSDAIILPAKQCEENVSEARTCDLHIVSLDEYVVARRFLSRLSNVEDFSIKGNYCHCRCLES